MNEEHFRKLERMYASALTNKYYQPELTIQKGQAEVIIPVKEDFFHRAGAVHGSVYFKALDDAAFFASNSLVEDFFVLTASFNLYFLRPVTTGELRAVGTVTNRSRRVLVAEAELFNSEGKLLAKGSGTFMPSEIPLNPAVGYA